MRIAIGGLMHESNTFAGAPTDLADFEAGGLEQGEGIRARWGDAHHEVGGFFAAAGLFEFEAVPTLMGWATPAGPLSRVCYETLVGRLVEAIERAGPVDAVVLALHGAMVAEDYPDADGETLARVRAAVGHGRPLVATLDYHANVSDRMAQSADALVAYQTYPHVDQRECGLNAAALAARAARGEVRLAMALAKPPLLIPILAQETGREPMRSLLIESGLLASSYDPLSISLLAGFPYADVAEAGPSCLAITDGDPTSARALADAMAQHVWNYRNELLTPLPGPEEAVRLALAAERTPALLIDLGDNIGGGSAADSTVLAHELIKQNATGFVVVLWDPEAVAACVAAGVGGEVHLRVGGKVDPHAPPLEVAGRVEVLHDGRYVEDQPRHGGLRHNDQGATAVLLLEGENRIVLNTRRHPPFSLGQLTSLGLRPERARAIVVKAAVAYKAAYAPIAGTIVEADTPGLTAANPARYTYRQLRRPILPLDPEPIVEPPRT